jgi:hypothetical protein
VSIVNSQVYATKEKDRETNVLVRITDIFGKFTMPVKVFLVRAFRSGKEDMSLLSNQEISPVPDSDKKLYSLDFLAARPDPGTYNLEFRVLPQEKTEKFQTVSSVIRRVQVVAAIGLSEGQLEIKDKVRSIEEKEFQQGETIKADLSLKTSQSLFLSFKLKNLVNSRPVQAHQVFLKLTHSVTKQSKYFIVESGPAYTIKLSSGKIGEKFNFVNGSCDLELLIGDSFVSASFRWVVAKIHFTFENKPVPSEIENIYKIRPEIHHNFRSAATLAPEILTYLFTALVTLPFIFFITSIFRTGTLNIPTDFTLLISAAIFVGGMGSLFCLILFYWFGLKLFTALTYGVMLSLPTGYFGKDILKYNAQHRQKKKTQ